MSVGWYVYKSPGTRGGQKRALTPGAGVTGSFESRDMEMNLGPLEDQQAPFTSGASLQPPLSGS